MCYATSPGSTSNTFLVLYHLTPLPTNCLPCSKLSCCSYPPHWSLDCPLPHDYKTPSLPAPHALQVPLLLCKIWAPATLSLERFSLRLHCIHLASAIPHTLMLIIL